MALKRKHWENRHAKPCFDVWTKSNNRNRTSTSVRDNPFSLSVKAENGIWLFAGCSWEQASMKGEANWFQKRIPKNSGQEKKWEIGLNVHHWLQQQHQKIIGHFNAPYWSPTPLPVATFVSPVQNVFARELNRTGRLSRDNRIEWDFPNKEPRIHASAIALAQWVIFRPHYHCQKWYRQRHHHHFVLIPQTPSYSLALATCFALPTIESDTSN